MWYLCINANENTETDCTKTEECYKLLGWQHNRIEKILRKEERKGNHAISRNKTNFTTLMFWTKISWGTNAVLPGRMILLWLKNKDFIRKAKGRISWLRKNTTFVVFQKGLEKKNTPCLKKNTNFLIDDLTRRGWIELQWIHESMKVLDMKI